MISYRWFQVSGVTARNQRLAGNCFASTLHLTPLNAYLGYLVHDGEETKALAQNLGAASDETNAQASGIIHIPNCCITRQVPLGEDV